MYIFYKNQYYMLNYIIADTLNFSQYFEKNVANYFL